IRRTRAGLKDPKRPGGSFIFAGPSGVGKTELSKTLAEFLFGDEDALIQLDMSEFMEKHTVSRLVGSPPGYVGYEEGGQLTERVKNKVPDELKQHFRPEYLNRGDDVILFHQLSEENIVEIVDLMITRVDAQMKNRDMAIELTTEAKKLLAKKGYDPVLGARPLRRTIQREIEDILSEKILYGELQAGQIVVVDVEDDPDTEGQPRSVFRGQAKPVTPDALPVETETTEAGP